MKKVKTAVILVLCLAVLASIFTVPTFAANAAQRINIPTIPELVNTIISWRLRPLFWFINIVIRAISGLPLIPGLAG